MKLGTRLVLAVFCILLISFVVVMARQFTGLKAAHLSGAVDRSRAITAYCEEIRQFVSDLRDRNAFDEPLLRADFDESLAGNVAYHRTSLYMTIPVVAAWTAARSKAEELGYRFRVPRNQPRNPLNEPRPGLERAVVDYMEGKGDLAGIEAAGGRIVFPEEPERAAEMGEIGVVHTGMERANDAEGGGIRPVDAVRFFRAIRLTEDCLSCHGTPKRERDPFGFAKEGWKAGEIHGTFEIISPLGRMRRELAGSLRRDILTGLLALGTAALLITILLRFLYVRPIRRVEGFARRVGEGDFTGSVDVAGKGEISVMAGHLNDAIGGIVRILKRLSDTSGTLHYASEELAGISDRMAEASEGLRDRSEAVASTAEEISAGTDSVAASAEEAGAGVVQIAAMAEEMSSQVKNVADFAEKTSEKVRSLAETGGEMAGSAQTVAAALEEMTASLNEVAGNTAAADRISQDAFRMAQDVRSGMSALSGASREIGKFVEIIKKISDQTNLLALNAAIEAAGAGEAGKGFAVVAGEVKDLAGRAAEATQEITGKVETIRSRIGGSVDAVAEIGAIIEKVADINRSIAVSVEEQSATAADITRNVARNADLAREVSQVSTDSSRLMDDVAKATGEISASAGEVSKSVAEISTSVTDIARITAEAAAGVTEIAGAVGEVRTSSGWIAAGAAITRRASHDVSEISRNLAGIVSSFQMGEEKFDIGRVKSAHLVWRSRLEGLLRGAESLAMEEVVSDHDCEFGKWLYGPEGLRHRENPHYPEIEKEHKKIHDLAREVVRLQQEGRVEEAEERMERFESARAAMFRELEAFYIE